LTLPALNVIKPPIVAVLKLKVYRRLEPRRGTNNFYIPLYQPSPIICRGSKSAQFWLEFRPHSPSERCDFKTEQKNQKSKTIAYSIDVWALICRRLRASRAPYSAARERIAFNFHKMVLCGSTKESKL